MPETNQPATKQDNNYGRIEFRDRHCQRRYFIQAIAEIKNYIWLIGERGVKDRIVRGARFRPGSIGTNVPVGAGSAGPEAINRFDSENPERTEREKHRSLPK